MHIEIQVLYSETRDRWIQHTTPLYDYIQPRRYVEKLKETQPKHTTYTTVDSVQILRVGELWYESQAA